jgi:hypothetical protein
MSINPPFPVIKSSFKGTILAVKAPFQQLHISGSDNSPEKKMMSHNRKGNVVAIRVYSFFRA